MIRSMTGYGKAEALLENGKLSIEIRSVNGKNAEIAIKSPLLPKDKELSVRKKLADNLQRGTIDMFITWEANAADNVKSIDTELAMAYYSQIGELGERMGTEMKELMKDPCCLMSTILRMPDVIDSRKHDIINAENWSAVEAAIDEAIAAINKYRADEGISLYNDVTSRITNILSLYDEIEGYAEERTVAVRERILKAAEDLKVKIDKERLEQEMIFYLEKYDINEENVRLRQHCKYFMDTIDNDPCPGKKLGFILQEMGREINTTGSKANHAGIQKCVVRMKDELEKIREQSMNIL